ISRLAGLTDANREIGVPGTFTRILFDRPREMLLAQLNLQQTLRGK
ncbi:MAG: hypothetical protein JWN92_2045, partial [Candidatus Acidoferrum typicum]|nr:hypothetical protein [Candidatus Acidoferrum typicum]